MGLDWTGALAYGRKILGGYSPGSSSKLVMIDCLIMVRSIVVHAFSYFAL